MSQQLCPTPNTPCTVPPPEMEQLVSRGIALIFYGQGLDFRDPDAYADDRDADLCLLDWAAIAEDAAKQGGRYARNLIAIARQFEQRLSSLSPSDRRWWRHLMEQEFLRGMTPQQDQVGL